MEPVEQDERLTVEGPTDEQLLQALYQKVLAENQKLTVENARLELLINAIGQKLNDAVNNTDVEEGSEE